jgi:hypothetical protein
MPQEVISTRRLIYHAVSVPVSRSFGAGFDAGFGAGIERLSCVGLSAIRASWQFPVGSWQHANSGESFVTRP